MNAENRKTIVYMGGFFLGAVLLCFFSLIQKITLGYSLFIKGFIVPFVFGGACGLIITFIIFRLLFLNKNMEIIISERTMHIKNLLQEKETLLKEVHHRIKNNIGSIGSLLSLQLQSVSNPEAVSALQDAITRVQGMRILYDKLLISKDYLEVSIKEYTESLIDAIIDVFPESGNVTIDKQIADFNLNTKSVIPIGIIINELLTNIYKYAFKGRDGGQISIAVDKTEKYVTLTIQDNGNGIDERVDLNKSPGLGLMLVRMLSEQLGGSFVIENHNGTKSVLKFDI